MSVSVSSTVPTASSTMHAPMALRDPRAYTLQQAGRRQLDPFSEIGTTGLKQLGGFVLEEWLVQLSGRRAAWAYREMIDNSAVVGGILFAIEMLARKVSWGVEGGEDRMPNGQLATEFAESCLHDMSHTWGDFVCEALSMLPYGWAFHETVYKQRKGRLPDKPVALPEIEGWGTLVNDKVEDSRPASSEYKDGLVGWRKIPIRAQETLMRWRFNGYAGLEAMEQVDWHGGHHIIPIQKALLFRTRANRNNPEGRSVLRNAWESWYLLKNIQNIEAIGVERELAGIPEIQAPPHVDVYAPNNTAVLARLQDIMQSIRRDENAGIIMPNGYVFKLIQSAGSRQIDTDKIIRRYRQDIALSVLADFILVGQDALGSYAMVDIKSNIFGITVDTFLDMICDIFVRYAFPRLMALNGVTLKEPLRLTHTTAGRLDLEKLGRFLQDLALAQAPIPWSKAMLAQLFGEAGLPAQFDGETITSEHTNEEQHAGEGRLAPVGDPSEGRLGDVRQKRLERGPERVKLLNKAEVQDGVMVALYPSERVAHELAVTGGEDPQDLHVTLAYLGKTGEAPDRDTVVQAVQEFAKTVPPLSAQISGHGVFTAGPEPVTYASVDGPELAPARHELIQHFRSHNVEPRMDHGFTPHITLAYDRRNVQPANHHMTFDHVALVHGGVKTTFPLKGSSLRKAQQPGEDGAIDIRDAMVGRANAMSVQLEREIQGVLAQLGEQAAGAYHQVVEKGMAQDAAALARKVIAALDLRGWVQKTLTPLLRNHSARVAGDVQRVLQHEVNTEIQLATSQVQRLERAAGRDLQVRDIQPAVRDAIRRAIQEGLERGENPTKVAARIKEMVPAGRFTHAGPTYRARLIARQETLHQQRLATLEAYKSVPTIESVRVRDGIYGSPRSDEACINRSGEIIPLDEAAALAPELHPLCTVTFDPVVQSGV